MAEERKPFWAKCGACCHCWIAAYYPMTMDEFSKAMKMAYCPMCLNKKANSMAKQDDGVLKEPA